MAKTHIFTVTGRGEFPFDMLRYDATFPLTEQDAFNIPNRKEAEPRSVTLVSAMPPTPARWQSFGWNCSKLVR